MNCTGDTVVLTKNNDTIVWTVVENNFNECSERTYAGLKPDVLEDVTKDVDMISSEIYLRFF